LLLDIDDQTILIPNTFHVFSLDKSVANFFTSHSTKDGLDIIFVDSVSLILDNFESLKKAKFAIDSINAKHKAAEDGKKSSE
jgi:hypothetical protein